MSTAYTLPLVSALPQPDTTYRVIWLGPAFDTGHFRSLVEAVGFATARATAALPWTIRLHDGTYNIGTDRLVLTTGVNIIGESMDNTIIETSAAVGTLRGDADGYDPVIFLSGTQQTYLSNLTVRHNGTGDVDVAGGLAIHPGANWKNLRMDSVRMVGRKAFQDTESENVNGQEAMEADPEFHGRFYNCEFLNSGSLAVQTQDRIYHFYDCSFRTVIDSAATYNSLAAVRVSTFRPWHHEGVWYLHNCDISMEYQHDLVGTTGHHRITAIRLSDTTVQPKVFMYGGRCLVDISAGDMDASSGTAGIVSAVEQTGTGYEAEFHGVRFMYRTPTGGLTDCDMVAGYVDDSDTATPEQNTDQLFGCTFTDMQGTGGTVRGDLGFYGRTASDVPQATGIYNCTFESLVTAGAHTLTAAERDVMFSRLDSINEQKATESFTTSTTVTLPVSYPAGYTEYTVLTETDTDARIWVTGKSNTQFTLNSSAGGAVGVRWVIRR
jgi:hypothetical protein